MSDYDFWDYLAPPIHKAVCLCDLTPDGKKFVEQEECPRHGVPGKRFGETLDGDEQ